MAVLLDPSIIKAEKARRSFKLFVEDAWPVIEPGRPFVSGWHLDAIADHLQAVAQGQIKRLLVNMPPRHGKSSLISVLWSGWLLLNDPAIRLLCASYAMNLATRDNLKVRRLIKSNWFQQNYGHIFTLTKDQDAKMKFETDKLGYRMAVSVGSSATGEGGDILILDDPHNIDEKESQTKREAALDWFDNTWSTRLNSQVDGKMVTVGQRIHENDVSGHILDTNDGEWVHLNLPAEFETANPCRTYLPSGKEFWSDPRTEEGELLWEARFPKETIEKAKRRHLTDYHGLYQQAPVAKTGGTFSVSNERLFTQSLDAYFLHTPRGVKAIAKEDCDHFLSVDPAISEAQNADYMVIGACAKTPMKDLLLLHVIRGHWSHPDQQEEIEDAFNEQNAEYVAVETVAYQHALFQDLVVKGIPCRPFTPQKDKVSRAATASIWQANGKIYFLKDANWLSEFQKELYKFPRAAKDDQVDMLSLASIAVRSRGALSDEESDEDIPEAAEETGGLIPAAEAPKVKAEEKVDIAIVSQSIDPVAWIEAHGGGWGGDW